MNLCIGVDPGLSGAVCAIDGEGHEHVFDTPSIIHEGGRRSHDIQGMIQILTQIINIKNTGMIAVLEHVHAMPISGRVALFGMGKSLGVWEGVLSCTGVPYELVSPQKWKKSILGAGKHSKDESLLKAQQLFPAAALTRKKDTDRAEALLMAVYAQRHLTSITCPI